MDSQVVNKELELAYGFVRFTNRNVFLTGRAGTGKTTFLRQLRNMCPKRMIVVAPTGVAAINAGGVTIHSFFQIGFGPQIPLRYIQPGDGMQQSRQPAGEVKRFTRDKINIMRSLDLLVIDEISMVRADLLDAIDDVLRRFRRSYVPFGGVQLLMIGDMQQLAPVAKEDEWQLLRPYYRSVYFFSSLALQKTDYLCIELKHIYRQRDENFIALLNRVRDNNTDAATIDELNKRYIPGFAPRNEEGYIVLTTHNAQAHEINGTRLGELKTPGTSFHARIEGDFPGYNFPTDATLVLKEGAQVMFVKNDPSPGKLFFNGKIGVVTGYDEGKVYVKCEDGASPVEVEPLRWENIRYTIDETTKEITEEVVGSFVQYPLKLAWAITIHKSQGLTFDRAVIDARAAFAFGQVYVALSRCRTLEGLVLSAPIPVSAIRTDLMINDFSEKVSQNHPGEKELAESQQQYQKQVLFGLFDFGVLASRFIYLKKLTSENKGSLTDVFIDNVTRQQEQFSTEVETVADRFRQQMQRILDTSPGIAIEKNELLQERVVKAAVYFSKILENDFLNPLHDLVVESDNRQVRKLLAETIENIAGDGRLMLAGINVSRGGFDLKQVLDARGKASVEAGFEPKKKMFGEPSPDYGEADQALLKELKKWRSETAFSLGKDLFEVLPHKLMVAISATKPLTIKELRKIKGFGAKRGKLYAMQLIEIIRRYAEEPPQEVIAGSDGEPSNITSTKMQSIRMFKSGMSPEQIAEARSLAISTINGHLAVAVSEGLIEPGQLVEQEIIDRVVPFFNANPDAKLSEAREALGEELSWNKLRYCQLYSRLLNNK